MERNEISSHEVLIYRAFRDNHDRWLTSKDVGTIVATVAPRTIRSHALKLVHLGLLDQAEVFPAHRYRWSMMAEKRNLAYARRIQQAAEVFGL